MSKVTKILHTIQTEAGEYSVNRVVPLWILIIATILVVVITVFIAVSGKTFNYLSDLYIMYVALVTACGAWLQGNKITNSIYNTAPGAAGKPGIANKVTTVVTKVSEAVNNSTTNEVSTK